MIPHYRLKNDVLIGELKDGLIQTGMKVVWRDTVGKSCKNSVLNALGANVWYNNHLMHHKVIIARICFPNVTHLFGSYIFFFTSYFIPTGPILLSLYFFYFSMSSGFF